MSRDVKKYIKSILGRFINEVISLRKDKNGNFFKDLRENDKCRRWLKKSQHTYNKGSKETQNEGTKKYPKL